MVHRPAKKYGGLGTLNFTTKSEIWVKFVGVLMKQTDAVSDVYKLNRDVLIAQLKNLVGPLFLSNETIEYIESLLPFSQIQKKVEKGDMTKNDVSDLVIKYANSLRKIVKTSGRGVITEKDVKEVFDQLKSECPFCVTKSSAKK